MFLADTYTCPILGVLLFWISDDISSGFQSQSGFCLIHFAEVNLMYIPWDSPLVLYLPTFWRPVWWPVASPYAYAEVCYAMFTFFMAGKAAVPRARDGGVREDARGFPGALHGRKYRQGHHQGLTLHYTNHQGLTLHYTNHHGIDEHQSITHIESLLKSVICFECLLTQL